MRVLPISLLLAVVLLPACSPPDTSGRSGQEPAGTLDGVPADALPTVDKARAAVKEFGMQLRGKLEESINAGGAVDAIGVCHGQAPDLAEQAGRRIGGSIRRVSLRTRNPDNEPDDWEIAAIENFSSRLRAGADPSMLEAATVITSPGGIRQVRYARAIATDIVCLTCHGENIIPPVQAKLDTLYPGDRATGHKPGDLRGIFSVVVPIATPAGQ